MSKRKLLLADDSMTIQKVINLTFADEGIEVFTVGNGNLAIEKLSEVKPDLVLADVHMPGLSGYEVCEQIKSNPEFKNVPVMLLVGSFEPFDENEAERVGANDYLTKPFQSIRQLIQKVTMLLDNSQSGTNNSAAAAARATTEMPQVYGEISELETNASDSIVFGAQDELETETSEMSFGDTALDDEMIETSSGSSFDNISEPITSASLEMPFLSEGTSSENTAHNLDSTNSVIDAEVQPTEPFSFDNFQELDETPALTSESATQDDDWQSFELETNDVNVSPTENFGAQSTPSLALDRNEFAAPQEDIFEISDFEDNHSENSNSAENKPTADSAVSSAAKQSAEAENELLELDLDDMNLLQIDDAHENEPLDLQIQEPMASASTPNFEIPAAAESASHDFSNSAKSDVTQAGSLTANSKLNLDFPPEVIEAIAQRVVEKMSDKVIERIAWEIVPDRFESIVRQHLSDRER